MGEHDLLECFFLGSYVLRAIVCMHQLVRSWRFLGSSPLVLRKNNSGTCLFCSPFVGVRKRSEESSGGQKALSRVWTDARMGPLHFPAKICRRVIHGYSILVGQRTCAYANECRTHFRDR